MLPTHFVTPIGPFSLAQLAEISGAVLTNKHAANFLISDVATLSEAQANQISMLHQKKYLKDLKKSQAGACIITSEDASYAPETMHLLIHKNPYKAYALITQFFYPQEQLVSFVAPSAYISASAVIGEGCMIAHGAYIGEKVRIGSGCKIGVNSFIGNEVIIGDDCRVENNVSICNTRIGDRVVVYPGACIGQDGFGFASDSEGHYKIPHRGGVIIGNDVEIGANTCIDRGSVGNTVIEDWCRLDNLIQIGHNVKIGKSSILCAQVGIAGSTILEESVVAAGKVGISGHLKIGAHATLLGGSNVVQDVPPKARMGGFPAVSDRQWHRQSHFLSKQSGIMKSKQSKNSQG